MSHSFQGFQPLSRLLCWELRGLHSFNFRLFMSVLYWTYRFWELKNEFCLSLRYAPFPLALYGVVSNPQLE